MRTRLNMVGDSQRPLRVYVLSGGSGHTANTVVRAALAQFDDSPVEVILRPNLRRIRDAERAVEKAAEEGAIVIHTLVAPKVREAVSRRLVRLGVPSVDLLGPVLTVLADHLGMQPRGRAGIVYKLHKEQFDRIDAVDFTLAHDDGRRVDELHLADVVLVGVSRSSKSATCFYLAARGLRAANVPIVMGQPMPPELVRIDHRRVFGLTMNASRLARIRQSRLDRIARREVAAYANVRDVARELQYANELMRKHSWTVIDVSYKATEEVASEIIERLETAS